MQPPSFEKWHAKLSNILSCPPTWSASPEAHKAIDNCMSFSNLSASPDFLPHASASSWAGEPFQAVASPPWLPFVPRLCCSPFCVVPQPSTPNQPGPWGIAILTGQSESPGPLGHPYPFLPESLMANSRFLLWVLLPQGPFHWGKSSRARVRQFTHETVHQRLFTPQPCP